MAPRRSARLRQKRAGKERRKNENMKETPRCQNSRSSSQRRAAREIHPPVKVLITEQDLAVQHWLSYGRMPGMPHIDPFYAPYCARPKPRRSSVPRSQRVSQSSSQAAESREKSRVAYESHDCVRFLIKNCCFVKHTSGQPTDACRAVCKTLLSKWRGNPPTGTAFDDDKLQYTLEALAPKPENAIIRVIGELVVPSVHSSYGLDILTSSIDEPWEDSIPLDEVVPPAQQRHPSAPREKTHYLPRPQPDYSVGFPVTAFNQDQLLRLEPFLGAMNSTSFFRSTAEMHFPFLVSEVKSKTASLHVAEAQSMHSMALCLRAVVYLFRLVKREQDLNRMILGFAIVHNGSTVKILGYYPVLHDSGLVTYHAHAITSFLLSSETRWTSFNFVMAVYHTWAPLHLARICAAVDQLPQDISCAGPLQISKDDKSTSSASRDLAASAEWSSSHSEGSAEIEWAGHKDTWDATQV